MPRTGRDTTTRRGVPRLPRSGHTRLGRASPALAPWQGITAIELHALRGELRQLGLEPDRSGADAAPLSPLSSDSLSIPLAVQATERALIEAALQRTKGNRTRAAKLLEISQRNLLNKIQRYEIDIPGQVGRPPRH